MKTSNKKPGPRKGAKYKRRKTERIPKTCESCGKQFSALLPRARFCSSRCRWRGQKRRQRGK